MILLMAMLAIAIGIYPQQSKTVNKKAAPPSELSRLREDFISKTREYKASLEKLITLYEKNVRKTEEKAAQARDYFNQGVASQQQLDESEAAVVRAKDMVAEKRGDLATADEQIAQTISEAELEKEYRQEVAARRRKAAPTCRNWTLTANRRERRGSVTFAFKLVCQN